ncbi:hypothetical protein [Streptomyces sp. ERV7]|uniref:hypothetical protein n=1 Tax=Streptomyces sp. ERV7 TaxID=1322334 RepID=UPI000A7DE523|nr:hypothetical protein [Streptomyces sp. ERV7]
MRKRSVMPLAGAAALVTAVLWGSPAGATQSAPTTPSLTAPGPALKAAITQELTSMSLPGCALTYAEHAGAQVTCLKAAPHTSTAAPQAAPAATAGICYYQHGPYGSAAMYNGWRACVTGEGDGYVPPNLNDQASAWVSGCTDGVWFSNQPWTDPAWNFPSYSTGNFPWGAVANDTLSSFHLNRAC